MIYYLFSIAVDVYTIRDEKRLYVPASCTFGVTGGGDSVSFTLKLAVFQTKRRRMCQNPSRGSPHSHGCAIADGIRVHVWDMILRGCVQRLWFHRDRYFGLVAAVGSLVAVAYWTALFPGEYKK
jgi:hypothetical protein